MNPSDMNPLNSIAVKNKNPNSPLIKLKNRQKSNSYLDGTAVQLERFPAVFFNLRPFTAKPNNKKRLINKTHFN